MRERGGKVRDRQGAFVKTVAVILSEQMATGGAEHSSGGCMK